MPAEMKPPVAPQPKLVNPLHKTTSIAKLSLWAAIFAIATAAGAITIGVMNWNVSRMNSQEVKSSTHSTLKMQQNLLNTSKEWQQQSLKIQSLQHEISQLTHHQSLSRHRKMLAVTYFVHLANLELAISQDKQAALNNLLLAKSELNKSNDINFLPIKQAIQNDIEKLKSYNNLSLNKAFHKIAQINNHIQKLSPVLTPPTLTTDSTTKNKNKESWYHSALNSLAHLKHLFVIKHLEKPAKLITTPEQTTYVKTNISLQLSMAQWALIHHNPSVFQQSIQTVVTWLDNFFQSAPQTPHLIKQLQAIQKIPVQLESIHLQNTLEVLANYHEHGQPNTVETKPHKIKTPIKPTFQKPKNQNKLSPAKNNSPVEI